MNMVALHYAGQHYDTMTVVPRASVHLVKLDSSPIRPAICGRTPGPLGMWRNADSDITCGVCQMVWGRFQRTQQRLLSE